MCGVLGQISTPTSPTYVTAVVEYSPVICASGGPSTEIVTRNLANYVLFMRQAAKRIEVLLARSVNTVVGDENFTATCVGDRV